MGLEVRQKFINLNTSYVDIKQFRLLLRYFLHLDLNTSYVDIKQFLNSRWKPVYQNLNTSYVDIKPVGEHTYVYTAKEFKYILC